MNLNFELLDLRSLIAISELGSFRRASEVLHLSEPAVSRRIRQLELALGGELFERSPRRVFLTCFGREVEPLARRLIADFENQLLSISGVGAQQSGRVTIACVPSAVPGFLPDAMRRFHACYPRIRLRILDLSATRALDSVASGEAEFGIGFLSARRDDLEFLPLASDPFVAACRHDHDLAQRARLAWAELSRVPLIGLSRTSGNRMLLQSALANSGVRLTWFYEVDRAATALELVEQGVGLAVLPRLAITGHGRTELAVVALEAPEVARTIGLVTRRGGQLSPIAQRLRDMLVDKGRLAESGGDEHFPRRQLARGPQHAGTAQIESPVVDGELRHHIERAGRMLDADRRLRSGRLG